MKKAPAKTPAKPNKPTKAAKKSPKNAVRNAVPTERQVFITNFVDARKRAGITQKQIHEETGIAVSYLSGVEMGRRNPTLDQMAKLAEVVGERLYKLLTPP